jgi:hypothetical protein
VLNCEHPVHDGLLAGGPGVHGRLQEATRAGRAAYLERR